MDYNSIVSKLISIEGVSAEQLQGMLEVPRYAEQGDIALPCFKLSKLLRKSPQAIADGLLNTVLPSEHVQKVESVGGYLNFFISHRAVAADAIAVAAEGLSYGKQTVGEGKTICIDYSSVNIAKPFHIGHLSTTAIGAALYRIFGRLGYRVVGINHLGDWGTQFGKLISAYKRWGDRQAIADGGVQELQKIYVRFHREAENNPQLEAEARAYFKQIEDGDAEAMELFHWFKDITLTEVKKIYERLDIRFDSYDGESFYSDKMQPVLDELAQKGLLVESDGAEVVQLDEYGMPPCLIRKADGATLYATRDLAAACYRKQTYDFYKSLYVVAYQQNLHFKQFFKVLELMGKPWAKDLEHVAFGMVSLEDGAMATRKGNVIWLADVLNEAVKKARSIIEEKTPNSENKDATAESVGVGAVVFSALYNGRIKDIVFSYDKILNFDGETSPYLQYTHARARSILRKTEPDDTAPDLAGVDGTEAFELSKRILGFPEILREAADKYEPCILTRYLMDLAQCFNRFYLECRIADAPSGVRAARLRLTEAFANTMKIGLGLLGISAPSSL